MIEKSKTKQVEKKPNTQPCPDCGTAMPQTKKVGTDRIRFNCPKCKRLFGDLTKG